MSIQWGFPPYIWKIYIKELNNIVQAINYDITKQMHKKYIQGIDRLLQQITKKFMNMVSDSLWQLNFKKPALFEVCGSIKERYSQWS